MSEPHCWPTRLDSRAWLDMVRKELFPSRNRLVSNLLSAQAWECEFSPQHPGWAGEVEITRSLGLGASQPSLINEHETNKIPSRESEVESFWGVTLKVAFWLPYAPAHISALYKASPNPPKKNRFLMTSDCFCIVHFCFWFIIFSCYWGASSISLFNWLF